MANGSFTGTRLNVQDWFGTTKIRADALVPYHVIPEQMVPAPEATIYLDGTDGEIVLKFDGAQRLSLKAKTGEITVGGGGVTHGANGRLVIRDTANKDIVLLDAEGGQIAVGGGGKQARLRLQDAYGVDIGVFDAGSGQLALGGGGKHGEVVLFDENASNVVVMSSASAEIALGGGDKQGIIRVQDEFGADIMVLAGSGEIAVGGGQRPDGSGGKQGTLRLQTRDGRDRIRLDAAQANIWLGGNGADGDLAIFSNTGDNKTAGNASIHLNGQDGDIILRNADCAEEFDSAAPAPEPGSVMSLDELGRLQPSRTAYDKRVAGVVSGAGDYSPGILLDRQQSMTPRAAVALAGKTYCKVDAQYGAIEVGDLLTTSPTPGHAMKASDLTRSFGAVIGKALRPLASGTGLIPVLVALQ
jgi:hypothetical protein